MTSNDQILLAELLSQRREDVAPSASEADFFELFTAEEILKDNELSWDEIEAGIVGGGADGGIDSVYPFINGTLVQEDTDFSVFKRDLVIDLHIIQSKRAGGFSEDAVRKFRTSSEDLLDFTKDLKALKSVYNERLIDAFSLFRKVHTALASRLPELRIHFHYATFGDEVHENVKRQELRLVETVKKQFSNAECSLTFSGAAELMAMARRRPRTTFDLPLADSPIAGESSYVCLVRLGDFAGFISDDSGVFQRSLFEANVRDYQGNIQVNKGIRDTLKSPKGEDFWWLNNGIALVATNAILSGKTLTLENPQIVNGHQTSVEVHEHFRQLGKDDETRSLLVRVIVPESDESHRRIIRATNSQTVIPIAFLKATDEIHRNIEDFFKRRGLYYDRRKNSYKNEGKPREKIVGIPYVAQAVMSVLLGRPDDARARPSTLLKKEHDYRTVFDQNYPLTTYLTSVRILKRVESFLREQDNPLTAKEVNNLKFHLAFFLVRCALEKAAVSPKDLDNLDINQLDDPPLEKAFDRVVSVYKTLGANDQAAKGKDFVSELNKILRSKFTTGSKTRS